MRCEADITLAVVGSHPSIAFMEWTMNGNMPSSGRREMVSTYTLHEEYSIHTTYMLMSYAHAARMLVDVGVSIWRCMHLMNPWP